MALKTEVYVDTSAFIAFLDRSDSHQPLFRRLFSDPPPLVSSGLVIGELHGWFLRRYDRRRAIEGLRFLSTLPRLTVIPFGREEVEQSTDILHRFQDQDLTLADAHGLAIMSQRRNRYCWSTDRHLSLTGVPLVTSAT